MAFECPRRSSPPSPMFDADTGCIATDPAPSARRRFRSKTGIENLPANEHAQETPHTPSPTRTTRRIQSGCAGSRPRLRDGMPGSPSQHIDITRAKWIPYLSIWLSADCKTGWRRFRRDPDPAGPPRLPPCKAPAISGIASCIPAGRFGACRAIPPNADQYPIRAAVGETSEITSTSSRDNRANARHIATSAMESHVP